MAKKPQFTMSFNIGKTNEERLAAFALYQKAFNAKKLWEDTPPNGTDVHIGTNICGTDIMIGPGGDRAVTGFDGVLSCEVRFGDNEKAFRNAYEALIQECQSQSLEGPYPWATLLALVTDKYGIGWALYYNEK
jgi:uncharacterized glyoxalase superfamily protein PhnB